MRILTPFFVRAWAGPDDQHPPVAAAAVSRAEHPPRALAAGVKLHGCSVHWVVEGVDEGPLIGQAAVPVLPGDDEEALAARVLAAEHRLYPVCLAAAITGQAAPADASAVLVNPSLA